MIVVGRPERRKKGDLVITGPRRALTRDSNGSEGRKCRETEKGKREGSPTPADEYVPPEVLLLEDKGES